MGFIDKVDEELNYSITENGALGLDHTKSKLVDFNFKIASYRHCNEAEIIADFTDAWYENKELALKLLFYTRDAREGVGERRLFRIIAKQFADRFPEKVFDWVVKYGRYDDLFAFVGTEKEASMLAYVKNQLKEDIAATNEGKPSISLLAKWMPSINTSSKETKETAKLVIKNCKDLFPTEKAYRQTLSSLRGYIDVLEKKLCANKWDEVKYDAVPSLANLRYKNAFMKHDEERRKEYLEALQNGETKINSSVNFPQDILHAYTKDLSARFWCGQQAYYNGSVVIKEKDIALEELWKALPDYVQGNSNILVMRDGSGSMTWPQEGLSCLPIEVSTALAIYFSERQTGEFKDTFMTFSSRPELVSLKGYETLMDKINKAATYCDCSNTDLAAAMGLILKTAVDNNMTQEEIPELLVISDMEFDPHHFRFDGTLFNSISKEYAEHGYKLPKMVFWCTGSRTNTIPIAENDQGLILVSGFSPAIVKMVLSNELDPYKALVETLTSERYAEVTLEG